MKKNTTPYNLPKITVNVTVEGEQPTHKIHNSGDVNKFIRPIFEADNFAWKESFVMLCMNKANAVIGYYKVSSGGTAGTVADPKIIYTTALNTAGTTSIIIAHNHPSGNLQPSSADDKLTSKIRKAGELLDITLLDHLILNPYGSYYSYGDEGRMQE